MKKRANEADEWVSLETPMGSVPMKLHFCDAIDRRMGW